MRKGTTRAMYDRWDDQRPEAEKALAAATREVDEAQALLDSTRRWRDALLWALSEHRFGTHTVLSDWTRYDDNKTGIAAQSVSAAVARAPKHCSVDELQAAEKLVLGDQFSDCGIYAGSAPSPYDPS